MTEVRTLEVDDEIFVELLALHWAPVAEALTRQAMKVVAPQALIGRMTVEEIKRAAEIETKVGEVFLEALAKAFMAGAKAGMTEIIARLLEEEIAAVTVAWTEEKADG